MHFTIQSVETINKKRLSRASDRPIFDLRLTWNPVLPWVT